jgi:hypothetical protein
MKLSDIHPDDVQVESQPTLKLSDVHPDDLSIERPEDPGMLRKLYESQVYPRLRSLDNFVPFGAAIHHAVIDPIAGAITGETADERQTNREDYDQYIRDNYPGALEGSEMGADLLSSLYKGPSQVIEPYVNQAVTHPESVGLNLQTTLNSLPVAAAGLAGAPGYIGRKIGEIKTRPSERASLDAYAENPHIYDKVEADAAAQGMSPREAMIRDMQSNIKPIERQARDSAQTMVEAKGDLKDANTGITLSKQAVRNEQRNAILDKREELSFGNHEGDQAKEVVRQLNETYKASAENRNSVLEQSQGAADIESFRPFFQQARREMIYPESKAKIEAAWDHFVETASENRIPGTISARQVDKERQAFQKMVDYQSGHWTEVEHGLNRISRNLNEALDEAIPINHPLRDQIRQETVRYNKAHDLIGGEYPLGKIKSAMADPMKRRELENLGIPALDEMIATHKYRTDFDASVKRGYRPDVDSQADVDSFTSAKQDAIKKYMAAKMAREQAKARVAPMSSKQVESTLNSSLIANPMHPRLNQNDALENYAENIHPAGYGEFWDRYKSNKVLRDLSTADTANGSRMVNLGKSIGKPIGAVLGTALANPRAGANVGEAAGAYLGAMADHGASAAFRGLTKYSQTPNMLNAIERSASPLVKQFNGIDQQKLVGTKYEAQMSQAMAEDPQKAAVLHYMFSMNDPEYQALMSVAK